MLLPSVGNTNVKLLQRGHDYGMSGSRSIIGVEDTKLYPIRGQAILVKSSQIHEFLIVGDGTYVNTAHNPAY